MVSKTKALALIPARGGSKSIPRKNIKKLNGVPLLAYSILAGHNAEWVDRVIVSTDDDAMAAIAQSWGAEVPFIRPAELAGDEITDLPVFLHALDWLEKNENYRPGIVVQLRPTSPLRPNGLVDEAIVLLQNNPWADSVRTVAAAGQNPYKMWRIEQGKLQPLLSTSLYEPFNMPRQKLPPVFWQTGQVDAIRRTTLQQGQSMTGYQILPLHVRPEYAIDLDTLEQWRYAEYLLQTDSLSIIKPVKPSLKLGLSPARIKLLVLDFDGVMTDNRVWVSETGEETVACDRADGLGLSLLRQRGIKTIVLSTETNPVVAARCRKLNLPFVQGEKNKAERLHRLAAEMDVSIKEIVYVGNDINDLECLKVAGWGIAVADAHPAILNQAQHVLQQRGGHGAVREVCEWIISQKEDGP